jgi:hypothetical protein
MMTSHDKKYNADMLLEGLKEIWNADFPKTCAKCGKVYENFDRFLEDTAPLAAGDQVLDYEGADPLRRQVGLHRNCSCGSTLALLGRDRRDTSEAGTRRREAFKRVLDKLIAGGLAPKAARTRLLIAMRSPSGARAMETLLGPS